MAKAQILVVEDEGSVARIIEKRLRNLGYAVAATASSGAEAIQRAAETHPDLVLMDIVLVGPMDGIEAAKQIRTRFDVPVVYLTGFADDTTLGRAKVTEPFGYILKPFQIEELHSSIEIALYKHEVDKALRKLNKSLQTEIVEHHNLAKTLEVSRANFSIIVKKHPDGILVVDEEGVVTYTNPAAEILFGREPGQLVGASFGRPRVASDMVEVDIISSDAEPGVGEMRRHQIEWEGKTASLVSLRDITDRRRAERAEDEAKQMNEKLRKANQVKDDFIANVSHELRTPLATILNVFINALASVWGTPGRELREALRVGETNTQRLSVIIGNLLDMSTIEAGTLSLEKSLVDIAALIRSVTDSFQANATEKGISLTS